MSSFEDIEKVRRSFEEEFLKDILGLYSLGAVTVRENTNLEIKVILTRRPEGIILPEQYQGINISYRISTSAPPYNEI